MTPIEALSKATEILTCSPELEAIIATSAQESYFYARDVLQGRFLEGEAIIAKSPTYAYLYAKNILKRRWPEVEESILLNTTPSEKYAETFNLSIVRKFQEGNKE